MTTKRIDARGLSCPQPVVMVSKAVAKGEVDMEILVDNEVARENVLRLAGHHGLKTDVRRDGMDIIITATKT